MAIDERRRSELFERLAATLGPDQATTMFELLPPAGHAGAMRSDIDEFEERVDRRFEQVDRRFEQVDRRFDVIEDRFDLLDRRIVEQGDLLRAEITAAFRGELVSAIAGQTKAVVTASVATALSVTAAATALAQIL